MGNVDFKKLIIASISGTAAMTVVMLMAPMMGVPKMDMGEMLGTMNPMIPMSYMMGWVMHFIIGIALTWFYAAFLIDRLPSDGWKRGNDLQSYSVGGHEFYGYADDGDGCILRRHYGDRGNGISTLRLRRNYGRYLYG